MDVSSLNTRGITGRDRRLGSVFEVLDDGVLVLDTAGRVLDANPAASRILGIDLASIVDGHPWWEALAVRDPGDGSPLTVGSAVMESGESAREVHAEIDGPDGALVMLSINCAALFDARGCVEGLVMSFRDITRKLADKRESAKVARCLQDAHDVARLSSWEWDPVSDEVTIFQAIAGSASLGAPHVTSEMLLEMLPQDERAAMRRTFETLVAGETETLVGTHAYDLPTGPAWIETRARAVRGPDGAVTCVRGTSQDVSERVAAKHELTKARKYLQAVTDSIGEGLMTLDRDGRLTYINQRGEQLLGWSAVELVGRVLHDIVHFERPDGSPLPIEHCSVLRARADGVTVRGDDEVFVTRSGRRMPISYTAAPLVTEAGADGCVVIFDDDSERVAREEGLRREAGKLEQIQRIVEALAENRLVLHAQPIVECSGRRVVQRELLVRMRAPDGRIIGPGEFLPVAEEFGLIGDIDRWVIEQASELARDGCPVELNLSACSVGDPAIIDHIERCLERSAIEPHLMVFEITETALIADAAAARTFAQRLNALGARLALDDFGTGYGGLSYLKQLPVDYLKIDVEFVRDLVTNRSSHRLVEHIVSLARSFGIETVAEGVEDEETFVLVSELGVDYAQGYHLGRPAPL